MQNLHFKAMNGQLTVDEAQGIVECFVAAIGNKDSVGDIIIPGAFDESFKRRKPRVVWGHDWNQPIGKVLDIYEVGPGDPRLPGKMKQAGVGGVYARVQFNLSSERGREAFSNILFFGEEQEWSIGYKTLDAVWDGNTQANILKVLELYEVSPVLHGANQLTATISVKDAKGDNDDDVTSLRDSKWETFDVAWAKKLKEDHPDLWRKGGNIKGNEQWAILTQIAAKGKATTQAEINALNLREAWIARHKGDFRIAGVVAQIKWLAVGTRGEDYMKNLVREAIEKKGEKSAWDDIDEKAPSAADLDVLTDAVGLDIPQEAITGEVLRGYGPRRGNLEKLLRYWRPIMRKPGGFRRCRVILADHPELYPLENLCAWLHHETTGLWPNEGCHHPGMKNCRKKIRGVVNGSVLSDREFDANLRRLGKKDASVSIADYAPAEQKFIKAMLSIVNEHGPLSDDDDNGIYVGYTPAAKNDVADMGIKCENCAFYMGNGSCKIVAAEVEPDGKCRLAAIDYDSVKAEEEDDDDYDDLLTKFGMALQEFTRNEPEFIAYLSNENNWSHEGQEYDEDDWHEHMPLVPAPKGSSGGCGGGCSCGGKCGGKSDSSDLDVKAGRALSGRTRTRLSDAMQLIKSVLDESDLAVKQHTTDIQSDDPHQLMADLAPVIKHHRLEATVSGDVIGFKTDSINDEAALALATALGVYGYDEKGFLRRIGGGMRGGGGGRGGGRGGRGGIGGRSGGGGIGGRRGPKFAAPDPNAVDADGDGFVQEGTTAARAAAPTAPKVPSAPTAAPMKPTAVKRPATIEDFVDDVEQGGMDLFDGVAAALKLRGAKADDDTVSDMLGLLSKASAGNASIEEEMTLAKNGLTGFARTSDPLPELADTDAAIERLKKAGAALELTDEGVPGESHGRLFFHDKRDVGWYDPPEFSETELDDGFWGEDSANDVLERIIVDANGNKGIIVDVAEEDQGVATSDDVPSTNNAEVFWFDVDGKPAFQMEDIEGSEAGNYTLFEGDPETVEALMTAAEEILEARSSLQTKIRQVLTTSTSNLRNGEDNPAAPIYAMRGRIPDGEYMKLLTEWQRQVRLYGKKGASVGQRASVPTNIHTKWIAPVVKHHGIPYTVKGDTVIYDTATATKSAMAALRNAVFAARSAEGQ